MWKALFAILAVALLVSCFTDGVDTPGWFPAPDKPDGPDTIKVGVKAEFETEGTDPADVHEFQWDFGVVTTVLTPSMRTGIVIPIDNFSDWDDDYEKISHRYDHLGTFEVKVRERCPLRLFESGWSEGHEITVKK